MSKFELEKVTENLIEFVLENIDKRDKIFMCLLERFSITIYLEFKHIIKQLKLKEILVLLNLLEIQIWKRLA